MCSLFFPVQRLIAKKCMYFLRPGTPTVFCIYGELNFGGLLEWICCSKMRDGLHLGLGLANCKYQSSYYLSAESYCQDGHGSSKDMNPLQCVSTSASNNTQLSMCIS